MSNFYLCTCGKSFNEAHSFADHITANALFHQSGHNLLYQEGEMKLSQSSLDSFVKSNLLYLTEQMSFIQVVDKKAEIPPTQMAELDMLRQILGGNS